jgi:uroporphyrinogen-III synthase
MPQTRNIVYEMAGSAIIGGMPRLPLEDKRIALLESRLSADIATLVRRLGGIPISAPSVREVPRLDDVETFIEGVTLRRFAVAIFQTGVGAAALFRESDSRGRLADVIAGLNAILVACRGPKPLGVLTRSGVSVTVTTVKPHTTRELLQALAPTDIQDRSVLLVHYGERNGILADALTARGAKLAEVCPYLWALPEEVGPIEAAVRDAVEHRLDAMLFTNQIQCRHLFEVARRMGLADELSATLNADVVIGAVGPVAADALRAAGVTTDILPASPNMASLISAVADYFELTTRPQ